MIFSFLLVLSECTTLTSGGEDFLFLKMVLFVVNLTVSTLWTGQIIEVGTVTVSNDKGNLYVAYL